MEAEVSSEMSTTARTQSQTREILTHALSIESRNALARVELAASELSRLEATPRMHSMLETIHDAVGEIDGLLGKIGLLSANRTRPRWPAIDAAQVLEEVLERVAPTLAARELTLASQVDDLSLAELRLALPEPAFARLLMSFFRTGLSEFDRGDDLVIEARGEAQGILVSLRAADSLRSAGELAVREVAARLELETHLAEWGGSLVANESGVGPAFWLPAEVPDA